MAKLTEQDFKKELSSGDLKNLYLIYGEEKYLVKKYTEQLYTKAAGKEPSDFDFVKLGSSSPIEDIISASEQLPVFSGYKCVRRSKKSWRLRSTSLRQTVAGT